MAARTTIGTLCLGGLVALAWLCLSTGPVVAQQATVQVPYHGVSEGFFENTGTSWGLRGKNWFFSFGGSPLQAAPQFGGFDPGAGATVGFGFHRGNVSGYFQGHWSQGFRQSFTSQAPVVTLWNGAAGGVYDASQSPFVIGVIPYVGGFPTLLGYNPARPPSSWNAVDPRNTWLQQLSARSSRAGNGMGGSGSNTGGQPATGTIAAGQMSDFEPTGRFGRTQTGQIPQLAKSKQSAQLGTARHSAYSLAGKSSAELPAVSVAEARRAFAAEQRTRESEVAELLDRADRAQQAGKRNVARVYYEMAARKAHGALRRQILQQVEALRAAQ